MFFWKLYFYSVFSKTQLFKNKNCMMEKNRNLWKIVGCFWTWQKGVYWGLFFWGFNVVVVCFCVSAIVPKVLKMLVFFPIFGLFWGGFFLFICVWKFLGVFVFLVFGFLFGVGFVSVCLLCFVLWLDVVVSVSFFVFFFCFFLFSFLCFFSFVFCFFGGFKGQVRWPKGPPHLALNPP